VKLVGAALGDDVDYRAGIAAIFRFKVGKDVHFCDGINRENRGGRGENPSLVDGRVVTIAVVHIRAVKEVIVGTAAGTIHGKFAEGAGGIGNLIGGAGNARIEENELRVITAVDRQVLDVVLRENAAKGVFRGVNLGKFIGEDNNLLAEFTGLQRGINAALRSDVHNNAGSHGGLETCFFEDDFVRTDRQFRYDVLTIGIGLSSALHARIHIPDGHLSSNDDRARGIRNGAEDGAAEGLGVCVATIQQKQGQTKQSQRAQAAERPFHLPLLHTH